MWLIVSRSQRECWNSILPDGTIDLGQMTSFNHYALGSVCNFLHRTVGGLGPAAPGWKADLVSPRPGGTIRHAHTSFDSPYGPCSVTWKIEGSRMVTNITVPPNGGTQAVLSGVDEKVGSGEYTFETAWEEYLFGSLGEREVSHVDVPLSIASAEIEPIPTPCLECLSCFT